VNIVARVILVTGATGVVGRALLPRLVEAGRPVRALVRDPRRLGSDRVRVQIVLGDLADPKLGRNAMRGVDTVIHLAASIRDQPRARIEELNGLATLRLLRAAEAAGVDRFIFFSALNASRSQRTRFFRAKALAEEAVLDSPLKTTVMAPSIVYEPGDRWITLMKGLTLLPAIPVSGDGDAVFEPIWAGDVAKCTAASLDAPSGRYELTGPERLTYDQMARLIARASGRRVRLLHVPLPIVRSGLGLLERALGPGAPATWAEAELMEVAMAGADGSPGPAELGVEPRRMAEVLSAIV